jgi:predicted aldo/keto reductase-like oxidoreductase
MFLQLMDAYDWEFCQVQYNYLDEHTQAGRRGVEYAHSKGVPVIIMEPLRGGRLVDDLPVDAKKYFDDFILDEGYVPLAKILSPRTKLTENDVPVFVKPSYRGLDMGE